MPSPKSMPDARAEALLLTGESTTEYRVVVLFDGGKNGASTRFTVARGQEIDTIATGLCGALQ